MPVVRRVLASLAAMLLCSVCLVAVRTEVSHADPCKLGKLVTDCAAIAKSTGSETETGKGGGGHQASRSGGHAKSGPSPEQIARKTGKAIQREWVQYATADKAYSRCVLSGGANCSRPKPPPTLSVTDVIVTLTGPRPANAPPAPQITPGQAGAIAVARLSLPANAPNIGPDPKKNKWKMAAVGYPLWLWADGPTHIGPVGENVGGLSVSLDARVSKTAFRMGDGGTVTCTGAGTPYRNSVKPGTASPTCGYRYEKPSLPAKKYTVTAITYWDVTWTVNGISGLQTVPMAATTQLPVGEVQTLVR